MLKPWGVSLQILPKVWWFLQSVAKPVRYPGNALREYRLLLKALLCSHTMAALMTQFSSAKTRDASEDSTTWANLREAIAGSSGFKGWKQQQSASLTASSLDKQVRLYLRETLETLAY